MSSKLRWEELLQCRTSLLAEVDCKNPHHWRRRYAQSIAPLYRKGDSLSVSCGQSCPQEPTECPQERPGVSALTNVWPPNYGPYLLHMVCPLVRPKVSSLWH